MVMNRRSSLPLLNRAFRPMNWMESDKAAIMTALTTTWGKYNEQAFTTAGAGDRCFCA